MYIWILLASIMVALSFFNLHPRADQENAFSEIKVATLTRRFRMEHLAFTHAVECEVIYNRSSFDGDDKYEKDGSKTSYKVSSDYDVGYTSIKENLPIGFQHDDNNSPLHYIVCLDNKGFTEDGKILKSPSTCGNSRNIYGVSFLKIPDRWISKQKDEATNLYMPLPAFTSFLGTELTGMKNTGWVYCDGDNDNPCHFSGRTTLSARYNQKELHIEKVSIPPDLIDNTDFREQCYAQPCLFAYDRIRNVDLTEQGKDNEFATKKNTAKKHCKLLMQKAGN